MLIVLLDIASIRYFELMIWIYVINAEINHCTKTIFYLIYLSIKCRLGFLQGY